MCAPFHERAGYRFQINFSFNALQRRKGKKNATFPQQTAKTLWETIKEPAGEETLRLVLNAGNSLGRLQISDPVVMMHPQDDTGTLGRSNINTRNFKSVILNEFMTLKLALTLN